MKEYICKEDLLERISLLNANLYTVGKVVASIQTQPTVTKIDICKEIAEELCEQWNIDSLCSISNTEQMRIWIKNKLLKIAEMEQ